MANKKGSKSGSQSQKHVKQQAGKKNSENENPIKEPPIKNSIKRDNFEQDMYSITVSLFAAKKLKANDLDVVFTSTDCTVTLLSDGRKWFAKFFREIDRESSKVQISRMKIILKMKKKVPGHWLDLEYIPGQSEAIEVTNAPLSGNEKESDLKSTHDKEDVQWPKSRSTEKSSFNSSEITDATQTKSKVQPPNASLYDTSETTPEHCPEENKDKTSKKSAQTDSSFNEQVVEEQEKEEIIDKIETQGVRRAAAMGIRRNSTGDQYYAETAAATPEDKFDLSDLMRDEQEKGQESDKEPTPAKEEEQEQQEGIFTLNHVKNDFIEKTIAKANDTVTVTVFVKKIVPETVELSVDGRVVGLKFQTTDANFIKMHEGSTPETFFLWKISVVDELIETQCSVKVKPIKAEITLRKKEARRWCALEAVNSKEYAQTSSTWKPVLKSTATVAPQPSSAKTPPAVPQPNTTAQTPAQPTSIRHTLTSQSKVGFSDTSTATKKLPVEHSENSASASGLTAASVKKGGAEGGKGYVLGESSKDNVQKPTCMVSPLQPPNNAVVVTPGHTGLDNLGNTCFMNSVLQVLANTTELRDFFLDGRFQEELNYDNVLGSGGKLAVEFGTLLKVLWSGKRISYAPSTLKKLVAQKKTMFSGFAQHDAQEYMSFLLDGLHEDLNRVKKKPYVEQTDSNGRPDHVVADEAWANHRRRNDSFLVDMFQGQFKSKLTCPACEKVSVTFDPFMHVAVPLPKKQRLLPVFFMWRDPSRRPVKFMLKLAKDASVENLKDAIFEKTQVKPCNLRVFEAWKGRVYAIFNPGASLNKVSASDTIFVQEVLSENLLGEPVKEIVIIQRLIRPRNVPSKCAFCLRDERPDVKLKRCSRCLRSGYCDSTCQKDDWHRHKQACRRNPELTGQPFIVSVPSSQLTYAKLYHTVDSFARYSVDVFQPPQSAPAVPTSPTSTGDPLEENPPPPVFQAETMFGGDGDDSGDSRRNSTVSNDALASQAARTETETVDDDQSKLEHDNQDKKEETSKSDQEQLKQGNSECSSRGINETHSLLDNSEVSESARTKETPKRLVIGRQQDPEGTANVFRLRPCTKDGMDQAESTNLKDKGEELLELDGVHFVAMDWKNDEKSCRPYVMVKTKELDVEDDVSVRDSLNEDGDVTLQKCISLFMQPEVLSSEEAWYCPRCKEHREATKQMSLWRLPSYLVIQLKRFSYRNLLWCDKVDKMVDFPTRGLDLSSYFTGEARGTDEPAPVYDLTGVVNHYGGILGGHYTAYVRTPDHRDQRRSQIGWRLCDDSRVSTCSEERVVTPAAYVLFYRRRDSPHYLQQMHNSTIPPQPTTIPPQPTTIPPEPTTIPVAAAAATSTSDQVTLKTSTAPVAEATHMLDDIADDFTSVSSRSGGGDSGVASATSSSSMFEGITTTHGYSRSSNSSMFENTTTQGSDSRAGDSGIGFSDSPALQQKLDFASTTLPGGGQDDGAMDGSDENEATYTDMDSVD